ncbi:MAG: hypothetical protein V7739_13665 [Motiliproteus sp.]
MRWFFLILLVLNIALFAWFQQEQEMRGRVADRAELSGVNVAPVRLLSEMPIEMRRRPQAGVGAQGEKVLQPLASADEKASCVVVSGFGSLGSARGFLLERLSADYQGRVIKADAGEVDYWVYVHSFDDVQQRQRIHEQLQDSGYEVSVARQGELKGQLSLGLYQRRELAVALYDSLKDRSYDADIFELPREKTNYLIQLSARKDGAKLGVDGQKMIADLLSFDQQLKSEKKVCEGVASR